MDAELLCPECRDGKHQNCVGVALTGDDMFVPCECDYDMFGGGEGRES